MENNRNLDINLKLLHCLNRLEARIRTRLSVMHLFRALTGAILATELQVTQEKSGARFSKGSPRFRVRLLGLPQSTSTPGSIEAFRQRTLSATSRNLII